MKTPNLFFVIPVVLGLSSAGPLHAQVCIDAESGDAFPPSNTGCTVNGNPGKCEGTQGRDEIQGSNGPDIIVGRDGNDRIHGGLGADIICAADGDDRVEGFDQNDNLMGGRGNDRLFGGFHDDWLDGGPGLNDSCTEGTGTNRGKENCP